MPNKELADYITAARQKGHDDERIKRDLIDGGWQPKHVAAALKPDDGLAVPAPPPGEYTSPRAVVQTFSTRGLEYIIMFIALAVVAISLGSLLHSSVNSLFGSSESVLGTGGNVPFAASALVVAFPVLAYLFLRLKKAEIHDPDLRHDVSRKRAIQLTLVVTFIVGLGNVIFFVYNLMSGGGDTNNTFGSSASDTLLGNFVHLVITLAIAGGIFYYYWRDEHQND